MVLKMGLSEYFAVKKFNTESSFFMTAVVFLQWEDSLCCRSNMM